MNRPRVLILSMSAVGAGHLRAAKAIERALTAENVECLVVDTFKEANPFVNKVIVGTYLRILKVSPLVYRFLYRRAQDPRLGEISKAEFNRLLRLTSGGWLRRLIQDFKPDCIVCTHAFACGVLSTMRAKEGLHIPIVGIITDFALHPFWLYDNLDLYLVASEKLSDELADRGFPRHKIQVTGIPIDPSFAEMYDRQDLIYRLGLNPERAVILVMGGGLGLGALREVVLTLGRAPLPAQMVVVAGHNESLYQELTQLAVSFATPTRVLGFVDNIDQLMDAADLIITKPGGLTSAEALAKGLPLIVLDPLPGQEEDNMRFLVESEVALYVDSPEHLLEMVNDLLEQPQKIEEMSALARRLSRPRAAEDIAAAILKLSAKSKNGG